VPLIPLRDNVPTRRVPIVTIALIAANVAVWVLYQRRTGLDASVVELGFQPCEVDATCPTTGQPWPANTVTHMFSHAGWGHLLFNMLPLWIFGNNVEDALGRLRFLVFYLLCGFAALAAQSAFTLAAGSDAAAEVPMVGASGAVFGVMAAYLVLLPHGKVLVAFFFVILREVPAWLLIGFFVAIELWQANFQLQQPPEGGGVAVFAHLGGAAFGLLTVKLFQKRRPLQPTY
jgi:membrane associated rhomboid family serine protease